MNGIKCMWIARAVGLVLLGTLTACGDPDSRAAPEQEAASRQAVPARKDIADIYLRSCRSCHTVAATGAPLTGDTVAWAPRMEKGMEAMVSSVTRGLGGMPPGGLCSNCTPQQYEALIHFMAETGQ